MKILVTGFRPFLSERVNPSELLAGELARLFPEEVEHLILPVEFGSSFELLREHLARREQTYEALLMLGQAAGRDRICLEKVALNWVQTEYADESGRIPDTGAIRANRPLAVMSPFPADEVYRTLHAEGLPVALSFSAGTFVCNELYFRVLEEFPEMPSLFVHVPLLPAQKTPGDMRPAMEWETQLRVLIRLLQARPERTFNEPRSGQ